MTKIKRILLTCIITSVIAAPTFLWYLNSQLPDISALSESKFQVPLRILSSDGKLIAEYGDTRRQPLKIHEIPPLLINAVIATEDRRFYSHNGVDVKGLARALVFLISTGKKGQGGGTITMQVARNFFLTRKKTFSRKINEILLAIKIDNQLSKEKILELYLNKIYFGKHAYGIEAAAQTYYGIGVKELSLAQMAMLAGLPQAPSTINPLNNPESALKRREHVLNKMLEYKFITAHDYELAIKEPLNASYHGRGIEIDAPYIAEMVRKEVIDLYGEEIYELGIEVHTTIDSKLQQAAQKALEHNLIEYTKRHGYSGAIDNYAIEEHISQSKVTEILQHYLPRPNLLPALITAIIDNKAIITLLDGTQGEIEYANMAWALSYKKQHLLDPAAQDIVAIGDIVYVEHLNNKNYELSQIPEISGAFVALAPENGAIKALVGGYDPNQSKFNRATQALRQPGSAFKPFLYTAALEHGFTAASVINDAPIVFNDPSLGDAWRPQNYTHKFYGPTRLRLALAYSMNLVSIKLLQEVGVNNVIQTAHKFGFTNLPSTLSLALGVHNTTPLQMAAAYATFANGGYKIEPFLISKILDSERQVIYTKEPSTACLSCNQDLSDPTILEKYPNLAPRILSSQVAYIMHSMLHDAAKYGTGHKVYDSLQREDLAGKTGSTNDYKDAWFVGYHTDLVAAAWLGFDTPETIYEYGGTAALPMWIEFMHNALLNTKEKIILQPPGIINVKIDPQDGLLAQAGQTDAIFEVFEAGKEPTQKAGRKLNIQIQHETNIKPTNPKEQEALF